MKIMMIIFVSGIAYQLSHHQTKPEDPRNINKKMKQLFNDHYNRKIDNT